MVFRFNIGYDLTSINLNNDLDDIVSNADAIPDIILVKKKYVRSDGKRIWKLKHLDKEVDIIQTKKDVKNMMTYEDQYEEFLKDIEENKDMRKKIDLYKDDDVLKELEGKFNKMNVNEEQDSDIEIKVEELLDELTLNDNNPRKSSIDVIKESDLNKMNHNKKQIGKRERTGKQIEDDI